MRLTSVWTAGAALIGLATAAISSDGVCGGLQGRTCLGSTFGNCCSKYNYCGSTSAYCGTGCQSGFGSCTTTATTITKISTDGTCGGTNGYTCKGSVFGNCCSKNKWCGSTNAYCGTGCLSAFGDCSSTFSTTKSITSSAPSATPSSSGKPITRDATCGGITGYTCLGSVWGNCCSQYGWCGSTTAYCGTGCQSPFGTCVGSASSSSTLITSKTSDISTSTTTTYETTTSEITPESSSTVTSETATSSTTTTEATSSTTTTEATSSTSTTEATSSTTTTEATSSTSTTEATSTTTTTSETTTSTTTAEATSTTTATSETTTSSTTTTTSSTPTPSINCAAVDHTNFRLVASNSVRANGLTAYLDNEGVGGIPIFTTTPTSNSAFFGPVTFSIDPTTNILYSGGLPFYDYYYYGSTAYAWLVLDKPASRTWPGMTPVTCSLDPSCHLICESINTDGTRLLEYKFQVQGNTDYLLLTPATGSPDVILTAVSV